MRRSFPHPPAASPVLGRSASGVSMSSAIAC
jgi:hypothetical protein